MREFGRLHTKNVSLNILKKQIFIPRTAPKIFKNQQKNDQEKYLNQPKLSKNYQKSTKKMTKK